MKLYDVPPLSTIKIDNEELLFHHIDGMYSLCTNSDGYIVHLPAWQEVEVVDDTQRTY